jgi:hypothetical protein
MSDPFCRADFPIEQARKPGLRDIEGVIPSWKMMTVSYVRLVIPPFFPRSLPVVVFGRAGRLMVLLFVAWTVVGHSSDELGVWAEGRRWICV